MSGLLMVPVKLDALLLEHDHTVVTATADFTALPYNDGRRDVNADTANLSENILAQPFENQMLTLKAGLHLHWALPDALTRGVHSPEGTEFPAVPNRWLVVRSRRQGGNAPAVESAWVVESDYVYPDGAANVQGSISVPVHPDPARGRYRPFRYQGRKVPLALWQPHDPGAAYLDRLTAVGYGEPTFAALYPNCLSVFGFHDEDYGASIDGLQYDVVGWYSDPAADPFAAFAGGLGAELPAPQQPTQDQLQQAIRDTFNWQVRLDPGQEFPQGMLCYARLTFQPTGASTDNPALADPQTTITIANTGVEALSAYLAQQIDQTRKAVVEEQLEALQWSSRLAPCQLDIGAKFQEARHEQGFVAVPGGRLWTIRPVRGGGPAPADGAQGPPQVTLPDDLAHALDALNARQCAYDRAVQEILSLRRQLFADWYKYMLCAYPPDDARDDYPDTDQVRYFVQEHDLLPLQERVAVTGVLTTHIAANGSVTGAADASATPGSLAAQVAEAVAALLGSLAALNANDAAKQAHLTYTLQPAPAPRYWLPREPVVLLTGAAAQASDRGGRDGLLACQVWPATGGVADLLPGHLETLLGRISAIGQSSGIDTWSQQPWNPFLLEWQIEVLPIARGSNLSADTDTYQTDFITATYALDIAQPDLTVRPGRGALQQRSCIYSGTSILTPQARLVLAQQLDDYLSQPGLDPESDVYRNFQAAKRLLAGATFHCLSQALGGFNEALLMRRQTLQLPVADPLGFADYQPFIQAVGAGVGEGNTSAPQPLWDFNPLRSGALRLLQLRLVDTFGQVKELDCSQVHTTEVLRLPGDGTLVALPPRLVQPARITFRWLAAGGDEQEMNDHPATTPVCGWLLPNNLDNSLMIYDNRGQAQGIIDQTGTWRGLADQPSVPIDQIANPHLRRLVAYLHGQPPDFLESFLSAVDSSLAHIDPENFAQHQELALLIGRPVALVRAALSLELQGLPAVRQAWNTFRQDLQRDRRDHDGFPAVRFPIRLGEFGQLNDGLVGYWKEQDGAYAGDIFYSPASDRVGHRLILTHGDDPAPILQALADPPLRVSMLVDPRGAVHATSGILPVKALSIPPDQYVPALQAIEIAFLTAPILTDVGSLNLPLPTEPGYSWSWLPGGGTVGKSTVQAGFSARQEVREGWLKLTRGEHAT